MKSNRRPKTKQAKASRSAKTRLVRLSPWDLIPSPENDDLYRPIELDDPEIEKLAESIREHGVLEPLVVTKDNYVISGHRRLAASKLAEVEAVPCRVENFRRDDDPDRFLRLLREHNRQRIKDPAEQIREAVIDVNPDDAHEELIRQREASAAVNVQPIELQRRKYRSQISAAKRPMLDAVIRVLEERSEYLPITLRAIHYALLNNPPLKHASKADSVYRNDRQSYQNLSDLLTRARAEGAIPDDAIVDETRKVTLWDCCQNPQQFIGRQFENFLQGYWRDYQQSQPNQIEIVAEKLTVAQVVNQEAAKFCIPTTIGRGYASWPPREQMAARYFRSNKETLVLLIVSDFDPDGETIAESFARSMRDDFSIRDIHPVKVALTKDQVLERSLPPSMDAKTTSANYKKFVAKYGTDAYELEALQPADLQEILREAILSVMDLELFNLEVDREREDAAEIKKRRLAAIEALKQ